jgi:hypothetical protein
MTVIIPNRWRNQKPPPGSQIDFGHVLSQRLIGSFLFNSGSGIKVNNLVDMQDECVFYNHSGLKTGSHGTGLWVDGNDDYIAITSSRLRKRLDGLSKITIIINYELDRSAGSVGTLVGRWNYTRQFGLGFGSATNIFKAVWRYGSTGASGTSLTHSTRVITETTPSVGRHQVAYVYSNPTSKIYIDRWEIDTSSGTGGALNDLITDDLWFGRYAAVYGFKGIIYSGLIYSRELLFDEIKELYQNPYANILPPSSRRYFPANTTSSTTEVTSTISTTWNVRQAVASSLATTWNVRSAITAGQSTTWNVRTSVDGSAVTTWNVRSAIDSSLATTWNARSAITAAQATTWNVRSAITASQSATWNVRSAITSSLDTTWNVRSVVTGSIETTWDVEGPATSEVTSYLLTTWNVRACVAGTVRTRWNVQSNRGMFPPLSFKDPRNITSNFKAGLLTSNFKN